MTPQEILERARQAGLQKAAIHQHQSCLREWTELTDEQRRTWKLHDWEAHLPNTEDNSDGDRETIPVRVTWTKTTTYTGTLDLDRDEVGRWANRDHVPGQHYHDQVEPEHLPLEDLVTYVQDNEPLLDVNVEEELEETLVRSVVWVDPPRT